MAIGSPGLQQEGQVEPGGASGSTFLQKVRIAHLLEQSTLALRAADEAEGCQGSTDSGRKFAPSDPMRDSATGYANEFSPNVAEIKPGGKRLPSRSAW